MCPGSNSGLEKFPATRDPRPATIPPLTEYLDKIEKNMAVKINRKAVSVKQTK
jgi:hypothetical protein